MLHLTPGLTAYLLTLSAVLGLVMGSFLNCLAWRLAHGESVAHGRSHCAVCGHRLGAGDLIPVLSWLLLRGRCRYCGQKISARYPLTELLCGVVYVSIVLRWDVSWQALRFLLLASVLLAASLVDLEVCLIPDRLIAAGILGFVLLAPFSGEPLHMALFHGAAGGLSVSLPLLLTVLLADRVWKRETMGGGDLKLLFMIGLYFNWKLNLLLLIAACVLGLLLALILGRAKPGTPFPFGPAIAAAAWFVMLFGTQVLNWYLGLFF